MEALILKIGGVYYKYALASEPDAALSLDTLTLDALTLGRAFTNDIIVADPYVGESQLRITLSPDSEQNWQLEITDLTNPVFLNGRELDTAVISLRSGDRLTTGRTDIVFYSEQHTVPVTRVFSMSNWLHNHKFKPYIAILMLVILFASTMLAAYLEMATDLDWGILTSAASGYLVVAFIWAASWALAGRLISGNHYLSSHLFFTAICLVLLLLLDGLGSYIDFMFSSLLAGEIVDWVLMALLGGLLIGLNMSLVTHSSGTFFKGLKVSVIFVATIAVMITMNKADYSNTPTHSLSMKPSFIPKISSMSIDQYIDGYDALFDKLDK